MPEVNGGSDPSGITGGQPSTLLRGIVGCVSLNPTKFSRRLLRTTAAVVIATWLWPVVPLISASYDEMHSAAVARCEAIDPSASQSGLLFNPDGYRSYYLRSECLQKTAVEFRDESLCRQVKQRWSLFSSSWGYSPGRCRDLVRGGIAEDEQALRTIKADYLRGPVALRDFRVDMNGNGRDFDIIPAFAGTYAHGYILTFEILRDGEPPVLFYSSGHHVDGQSNVNLYVRQSEIRERFPALALNHPYTVRGTVTLDVGNGTSPAHWSDAFVERIFPRRERTASLTKTDALVAREVIFRRPRFQNGTDNVIGSPR
jgi:hypothetical protein